MRFPPGEWGCHGVSLRAVRGVLYLPRTAARTGVIKVYVDHYNCQISKKHVNCHRRSPLRPAAHRQRRSIGSSQCIVRRTIRRRSEIHHPSTSSMAGYSLCCHLADIIIHPHCSVLPLLLLLCPSSSIVPIKISLHAWSVALEFWAPKFIVGLKLSANIQNKGTTDKDWHNVKRKGKM